MSCSSYTSLRQASQALSATDLWSGVSAQSISRPRKAAQDFDAKPYEVRLVALEDESPGDVRRASDEPFKIIERSDQQSLLLS